MGVNGIFKFVPEGKWVAVAVNMKVGSRLTVQPWRESCGVAVHVLDPDLRDARPLVPAKLKRPLRRNQCSGTRTYLPRVDVLSTLFNHGLASVIYILRVTLALQMADQSLLCDNKSSTAGTVQPDSE